MRAFVAVEVPATTPGALVSRAAEHLTLVFLGEVPADGVARIIEALKPIGSEFGPFPVTLEGVGGFPSRERPRVVWVGATEGAGTLASLARRAREALELPEEGSRRETFVPHLTLFRVRSPADRRRAEALLSGAIAAPAPRRFHVAEFVLKESVLSARGATHTTVAAIPLSGSGSGSP